MATPVVASGSGQSSGLVSTLALTAPNLSTEANRVLYVFVKFRVQTRTGAVDLGGTALDLLTRHDGGDGTRIELHRLINPPSGTAGGDLNLTISGGTAYAIMSWVVVENADQTTPNGTVQTANGTGTAVAVAVPSTSGQMTISGTSCRVSAAPVTTLTTDASQTNLTGMPRNNANQVLAGASYETATGSSTSHDYTLSASQGWAILGIAINEVSGSSATYTQQERRMPRGLNRGM